MNYDIKRDGEVVDIQGTRTRNIFEFNVDTAVRRIAEKDGLFLNDLVIYNRTTHQKINAEDWYQKRILKGV